MTDLSKVTLKGKNFRCFGEIPQGFEGLKSMNAIIGKNNSGKSALIDLVRMAISPVSSPGIAHKEQRQSIFISQPLTDDDLSKVFRVGTSGGNIPGPGDHYSYGKKFIGLPLTVELDADNGNLKTVLSQVPELMPDLNEVTRNSNIGMLTSNLKHAFLNKKFRKLSAERDITKENISFPPGNNIEVDEHGHGATTLINSFIQDDHLDESLVEQNLLKALREIYGMDADFTRISSQKNNNQEFEIYLEEPKKGRRIALSNSGSSLKTVLLVLINVLLIPGYHKSDLSDYVFAFEELENNLHPSLQRRLISYLRKLSVETGCIFLLSTHSNVIIDILSHDENSKILHVRHNGEFAEVSEVNTHTGQSGVLDDLDYRASDVLQANGVIWVEGPSDRIYLKKWIELWSHGTLEEGVHYQFVFYGGSIRKHLSGKDPDEVRDAISVFRINRNSIVVMDSDKSSETDTLDSSKTDLEDEFKGVTNGLVFITAGRDIENYIDPASIQDRFKLKDIPRSVGKFEEFSDYLEETVKVGKGKTFENNKVLFADKIKEYFQQENMQSMEDLDEKMLVIISLIKRWNKLNEA